MSYTPENNPYIPGDPYSYDLKWLVTQIKSHSAALASLDETIQAAVIAALDQHDPVYYETAQDLIDSTQKAGSIAYIEGYHAAGDGGANLYYVTDNYNDIIGAAFYLTLTGSNRWALPIILTPYITPEMFGAKGDGVEDDTAAVQKSIDIAFSSGKKLISCADKIYSITDTIIIPDKTVNSSGVITIDFGGALFVTENITLFKNAAFGGAIDSVMSFGIRLGNFRAQCGSGYICALQDWHQLCELYDITAISTDNAFYLVDCYYITLSKLFGIYIGAAPGTFIYMTALNSLVTLNKCVCANYGIGLKIHQPTGAKILSCDFEKCTNAITTYEVYTLDIDSCYLENNDQNINCTSYCRGLTIDNCYFNDNTHPTPNKIIISEGLPGLNIIFKAGNNLQGNYTYADVFDTTSIGPYRGYTLELPNIVSNTLALPATDKIFIKSDSRYDSGNNTIDKHTYSTYEPTNFRTPRSDGTALVGGTSVTSGTSFIITTTIPSDCVTPAIINLRYNDTDGWQHFVGLLVRDFIIELLDDNNKMTATVDTSGDTKVITLASTALSLGGNNGEIYIL